MIFNGIVLALVLALNAHNLATGVYRHVRFSPLDVVLRVVGLVAALYLAVARFVEPGAVSFVLGTGWTLVASIDVLVLRDARRRELRCDCNWTWREECYRCEEPSR